jgi:hypothetical protein
LNSPQVLQATWVLLPPFQAADDLERTRNVALLINPDFRPRMGEWNLAHPVVRILP